MSMPIQNCADFYRALIAGPYAWPGGYPIYFVMADGESLSFESARAETKRILDAMRDAADGEAFLPDSDWVPVAAEINYEDGNLFCAHSGKRIESAYAEPEESAS